MLTHSSAPKSHTIDRQEYPWALLLMVFAWLWAGVFSHDLWKPDEPQLYAVISQAARTGAWLPSLHGQAYVDVSPVYVQTALWFQKILTPWAAEPFAASRFASVLFTAIGLLGSGLAGYKFLGRHFGRIVVLILIGSFGLLPIGHFLNAQSPVFAAVGLALWGYAIASRQVVFSALLIASGAFLLAQSVGLLAALAVLGVGGLLSWNVHWRTPRFLMMQISTWAISLPLLAVYPLVLWFSHHAASDVYLQYYLWGHFADAAWTFQLPYYAKHLVWFAFPALPLAAWTIWRGGLTQSKWGVFSLIWLAVFGVFLVFYPQRNQDLLVLILPVLALLGAAQLDNLRRGVAAFFNWFGMMTFGLAAVFLWVGFMAMNYGFPAKLAERAAYFSPYYTRDIDTMPMIVALTFTPLWLIAITRKRIRSRQAITNWAAGTTLVWALLMTLFLPWIDAAKSYRPIVQKMLATLPENQIIALQEGKTCISIQSLHQDARLAWEQYAHLPYQIDNHACRYHLLQYHAQTTLPENHQILWQGRRPRNKTERFALLDTQHEQKIQ